MSRNVPHLPLILSLTICILLFGNKVKSQGTSRVDIGKSYANLSKLSTGGTFNPGDTIEIRVTVAVITQSGTPTTIDKVQVFDTVPAKTTYIPNSLRLATNEGVTYKAFTDAAAGDAGSITSGLYILMNLGTGATSAAGGTITSNTSRPSFYNSHCITMACYRVRINPATAYGDSITIGGKAVYRITSPSVSNNTVAFTPYKILLFSNTGYCSNGLNIPVNSDSLGTFASGTASNRASSLTYTTTYVKQTLTTGSPNDYFYAIVQNSACDSSTNVNSPMPEVTATKRVFGIWDICGDHTGSSTAFGNAPPAAAARGGYMVLVNASYLTDVAYQETLTGLCPSTFYEFSAWFRNVCPRCGCDSTGKGSGSPGYLTGPGNDSSGVHPNLNFEIDGLAYFSSGDIKYDRAAPWKKYGFTFTTKAGQTTAQFVIRNNSPGGGGNDWAVDDIKVSHCGPTLKMNYAPIVTFCKGYNYPLLLADTIRYLYSNSYVKFKWQQSNIGGTIWTDMVGAGTSGTGTPTMVNGQWQYVTSVPWFYVTSADSGRYYRVIVATTAGNLSSPTCAYTDGTTTMVKAITCGSILTSNFTQFNGQIISKNAYLTWAATGEDNLKTYEIEKSSDGVNFTKISAITAKNMQEAYYAVTDPDPLTNNNYYRIKIIDNNDNYKFSNIILLTASVKFDVRLLQNPFKENINANVIIPTDGMISVKVFNDKGQVITSTKQPAKKGSNGIVINNLANSSNGMYFLSVEFNSETIKRKMIKVN